MTGQLAPQSLEGIMVSGPAVLARIPGADPSRRDTKPMPDEKAQVPGLAADDPADPPFSQIVDVAVSNVDSPHMAGLVEPAYS